MKTVRLHYDQAELDTEPQQVDVMPNIVAMESARRVQLPKIVAHRSSPGLVPDISLVLLTVKLAA